MIAEEYGISGGFCGPGMTYEYKGGRQPAFWLGFRRAKPKPTLAGRRLVEEVRRVMEIRQ